MAGTWSVRKENRRDELKMQNHVVASYKNFGGYAKKWASDLQAGQPDLVAALPGMGGHLIEMKHRPEWGLKSSGIKNPMEPLQVEVCGHYIRAGMPTFGLVIVGSSNAMGSHAVPFHPLEDRIAWDESIAFPYIPKRGYDVTKIWRLFLRGPLR